MECPAIHFVEDRYETLLSIIRHNSETNGSLSHVRLYLADWGYNTKAQRLHCSTHNKDQITIIDQSNFKELVNCVLQLDT